ncbi:MAG: hypothetical protein NTZ67_07415 [Gammaproteobacteria bacterium]|nr:hypothetical protein [Gammaproteobacteria bacterium]
MPTVDPKKIALSANPNDYVSADIVAAVLQPLKEKELERCNTKSRLHYAGLVSANKDGTLREPKITTGADDTEAAENADELAKHPPEAISFSQALTAIKVKLDAETPKATQALTLDFVLHVNDNHFTQLQVEISADQKTIKVVQFDSLLQSDQNNQFDENLKKNIGDAIGKVFENGSPIQFEKKRGVATQFCNTCADWTAMAILDDHNNTSELNQFHEKGGQTEKQAKTMRLAFNELAKKSTLKDKIEDDATSKKVDPAQSKKTTTTVNSISAYLLHTLAPVEQKIIISKAFADAELAKMAASFNSNKKYKKFELSVDKEDPKNPRDRITFENNKTFTIFMKAIAVTAAVPANQMTGQKAVEEKTENVNISVTRSVEKDGTVKWHCTSNNDKVMTQENSWQMIAAQSIALRIAGEAGLKKQYEDPRAITIMPIDGDKEDQASKKERIVGGVKGEFTDKEELLLKTFMKAGYLEVTFKDKKCGFGLAVLSELEKAIDAVTAAAVKLPDAYDDKTFLASGVDVALSAAKAAQDAMDKRVAEFKKIDPTFEVPKIYTEKNAALSEIVRTLTVEKESKDKNIKTAGAEFQEAVKAVDAANAATVNAKTVAELENLADTAALASEPHSAASNAIEKAEGAIKKNFAADEQAGKFFQGKLDEFKAGLTAAAESKKTKINEAEAAIKAAEAKMKEASATALIGLADGGTVDSLSNVPAVENRAAECKAECDKAAESYAALDDAAKTPLKDRADKLAVDAAKLKANADKLCESFLGDAIKKMNAADEAIVSASKKIVEAGNSDAVGDAVATSPAAEIAAAKAAFEKLNDKEKAKHNARIMGLDRSATKITAQKTEKIALVDAATTALKTAEGAANAIPQKINAAKNIAEIEALSAQAGIDGVIPSTAFTTLAEKNFFTAEEKYNLLDDAAKAGLANRRSELCDKFEKIEMKENGNLIETFFTTIKSKSDASKKIAAIKAVGELSTAAKTAIALIQPAITAAADVDAVKALSADTISAPETALITKALAAIEAVEDAIEKVGVDDKDAAREPLAQQARALANQLVALQTAANEKIKAIENVGRLFKEAEGAIAAANKALLAAEDATAVGQLSAYVSDGNGGGVPSELADILKAEAAVVAAKAAFTDLDEASQAPFAKHFQENLVAPLAKLQEDAHEKIKSICAAEVELQRIEKLFKDAPGAVAKANDIPALESIREAIWDAIRDVKLLIEKLPEGDGERKKLESRWLVLSAKQIYQPANDKITVLKAAQAAQAAQAARASVEEAETSAREVVGNSQESVMKIFEEIYAKTKPVLTDKQANFVESDKNVLSARATVNKLLNSFAPQDDLGAQKKGIDEAVNKFDEAVKSVTVYHVGVQNERRKLINEKVETFDLQYNWGGLSVDSEELKNAANAIKVIAISRIDQIRNREDISAEAVSDVDTIIKKALADIAVCRTENRKTAADAAAAAPVSGEQATLLAKFNEFSEQYHAAVKPENENARIKTMQSELKKIYQSLSGKVNNRESLNPEEVLQFVTAVEGIENAKSEAVSTVAAVTSIVTSDPRTQKHPDDGEEMQVVSVNRTNQ